MKDLLKLSIGLFLAFLLSGCIGEDYDFSPPTVTISANDVIDVDLQEANLDWSGEDNKPYKKETKDITKLAKKQQQLTIGPKTPGTLRFDSEDFSVGGLSAYVLDDNNTKQEIKMNDTDRSFTLPTEKGNYTFVVDLQTDRGSAQYVGNLFVK